MTCAPQTMRGNEHDRSTVGTAMQKQIPPFLLILGCVACPLPPSHEDDGDSAAKDESGSTSETPDLPIAETSDSTETGDGDGDGDPGTGDGDGDGETETGDPIDLRWAVLDGNDLFVGWLASPPATEFADHENIFSGPVGPGFPREAFLTTTHEYGFWLVTAGTSYTTLGTADATVLFTEPGCSGIAHDRIGSMPGDGAPVLGPDCSDPAIDDLIAGDQVQMHYWTEQTFGDWMGTYWPGALGQVVSTPSLSHFYWLPLEQEWPEMLTAVSVRYPDGACAELTMPIDSCAVRLFDTIWEPLSHEGPYSLVEIED